MENLIKNFEVITQQNTIIHLYINHGELKVTYDVRPEEISYPYKSSFSNSDWETSNDLFLYNFLNLDHRERDISDTLVQQGYFLVGEMMDVIPDYLLKFIQEHSNEIVSDEVKLIKRSHSAIAKNLIYLKLYAKIPFQKKKYKKYANMVQKILQNF